MPNEIQLPPWTQPGWFERVCVWIEQQLAGQNIALQGQIGQPYRRPWSTVLRVPTNEGALFFKATTSIFAHEPPLTETLANWWPDCMPEVLASDLAQGWLLLRDAGQPLRSRIQADQTIDGWLTVLPRYADIQRELAERVDALLAFGLPDRRPAGLLTQYEDLLADRDALLLDQPDGLSREEYRQLQAMVPQVAAMADQVAEIGLPDTLHHDDFHDANIFVRADRITFTDWGECCLGHPFYTMVIVLRSAAYQLKLAEDDPALNRLRDAYLEPWTTMTSRAALLAGFRPAHRLGMLCRTLTWYQFVQSLAEPERSEYAEAVPGWLQEFLGGRLVASE